MGKLIKQKHINLYNKYIKQLIEDLDGDVVLYMGDLKEKCPNCKWDFMHKTSSGIYNENTGTIPFSRGSVCPVCKGEGEINKERSVNISCSGKWGALNDSDEFITTPAGNKDANFFRLKTYVHNYDKLKNAEYIMVDGVRTVLVNIIKRGLKENVVCIAICKQDG